MSTYSVYIFPGVKKDPGNVSAHARIYDMFWEHPSTHDSEKYFCLTSHFVLCLTSLFCVLVLPFCHVDGNCDLGGCFARTNGKPLMSHLSSISKDMTCFRKIFICLCSNALEYQNKSFSGILVVRTVDLYCSLKSSSVCAERDTEQRSGGTFGAVEGQRSNGAT